MTEQEIVNGITRRFSASATYQSQFRKQWEKDLRLWECILENLAKLKKVKRSHLYIPYTFSLIEWLIEAVITRVEGIRPLIKLIAVRNTRPITALRNETLLDYQLKLNKIQVELEDVIRQLLMHGNAAAFVSWDPSKTDHTGLVVEWVDIFNFYPDSKASSWKKCEWVIRRSERSLDYLLDREKAGYYKGVSKLKKTLQSLPTSPLEKERFIQKGVKKIARDEYLIEVLEYWNKYTKEWKVIAGREHLIKDEKNFFQHGEMPFAVSGLYRRPGIIYSKGLCEVLEDQQDELNAMRNLRRDQEKLSVKRLLKITRSSHLNKEQIQNWLSGGILYVNTPNDVGELAFTPLPKEAYVAVDELKREMQDTVGAQDPMRGVVPERKELATTMLLLQRAGQTRMAYTLRAVALLLCEVARLAVRNNQQFLSTAIPETVLAPEILETKFLGLVTTATEEERITREHLRGSFDFIPQLHLTAMEKPEKEQKALLLYRELVQDPYVDPLKRLTFLLNAFEVPHPEEWFKEQPNIVPAGRKALKFPKEAEGGVSQKKIAEEGPMGKEESPVLEQLLEQAREKVPPEGAIY